MDWLTTILLWGSILGFILYKLYKFSMKNEHLWKDKGVRDIKLDNFISRIFVKQSTFLDLDQVMYAQLEDLPYGGYLELWNPILFVKDVEVIKKVYVKDFDHFVNRRNFNSFDPHWNQMLFNKSDQDWKDLRSIMSPTFTTGKIKRMYPILDECSKRLLEYLKTAITEDEGVVNLEDVLGKYAMDVISSAAFGIESGIFKDPNSIISKMAKKLQTKFTPLVLLKFFSAMVLPLVAKIMQFKVIDTKADKFFTTLLKDSIQYRERENCKRDDFLQLMIETKNGGLQNDAEEMDTYEKDAQLAQDKKRKVEIDDDVIIANCILFILGGFDTTQSALIFAAYSLALHPALQDHLRRELQNAAKRNGGELTYDIINQLEYLDKVINETLRMYPPAIRTERRCTKDYTLPNSNIVIPKDTLVGIPVYQIHHDPKHFPDPEVFDPERFSPKAKVQRSPYAFMPFGHGPRNCIANRFALTETKIAIANLIMNFEIEPCAKTTIPMDFGKTPSLKPINGMWLKLSPISRKHVTESQHRQRRFSDDED